MQALNQIIFELVLTALNDGREGVQVIVEDSVIDSPAIAMNRLLVSRLYIGITRILPSNAACSRLRKVLKKYP